MWPNIAKMIGREDLIDHPKFMNGDLRVENIQELEKIFQDWLNTKTRQEIFEAVQIARVPGSPILEPTEVMGNEQFISRKYFQEIRHEVNGNISITGDPFKMPGNEETNISEPPQLGQHTDQVLKKLTGLTDQEVSYLRQLGIV